MPRSSTLILQIVVSQQLCAILGPLVQDLVAESLVAGGTVTYCSAVPLIMIGDLAIHCWLTQCGSVSSFATIVQWFGRQGNVAHYRQVVFDCSCDRSCKMRKTALDWRMAYWWWSWLCQSSHRFAASILPWLWPRSPLPRLPSGWLVKLQPSDTTRRRRRKTLLHGTMRIDLTLRWLEICRIARLSSPCSSCILTRCESY